MRAPRRKSVLWGVLLVPIFLLIAVTVTAVAFYKQYVDNIGNAWASNEKIAVGDISLEDVAALMASQGQQNGLSKVETSELARVVMAWVESQREGTQETFESFRYSGTRDGDLVLSNESGYYYMQFLENRPMRELRHESLETKSLVEDLYGRGDRNSPLEFRGNRLCLNCLEELSLESLEVAVSIGAPDDLVGFVNGAAYLSQRRFLSIFEPAEIFRRRTSERNSKSKTANVSFVVRTGNSEHQTYKVGFQFLWIPEHKEWFPMEFIAGYPGERIPWDVFPF